MLKKHFKLLIFILIIFIIFLIYKTNHKNYLTYIPLGDGYAQGKNSYGIIDYGYGDYLKDKIKEGEKLKFYTKEFTSNDATITSLIDTIIINKKMAYKNTKYNVRQLLREADIVTLSIGLNDLIYQFAIEQQLTEENYHNILKKITSDYNKLLKEIKKYYPKTIYIIGYPNIPNASPNLKKGLEYLNKFLSKKKDIIYIKTTKIITEKDFKNPTSYYISNEGYQKIAREVIKKLAKEKNI